MADFLWDNTHSLIVLFNDVSDQVREKQVKKLNRFKNKVLENMGHNLKTPLNCIMLNTYSIKNMEQDQEILDLVQKIEVNGKLLESMVDDILDYNKIERHKFQLDPIVFTLPQIAEDIEHLFHYQKVFQKIKINFHYDVII